MLIADGVQVTNTVGPAGIVLIIISIISGFFTYAASRASKKVNSKVGNGFTDRLDRKLDSIQTSANEAKRVAAAANESARKTRGIVEQARDIAIDNGKKSEEVRSLVDTLNGQFKQHIEQHQWSK